MTPAETVERILSKAAREGKWPIEKERELGSEEELEHTSDSAEAEQIAEEHLQEDPNYYEKLEGAGLMDVKNGQAVKKSLKKRAAVGPALRGMVRDVPWVAGGGAAGAGTGYALDPESPESAATLGLLGALSGTRGLRHQYMGGDPGKALRTARKGKFDDPVWNMGEAPGTYTLPQKGGPPIEISSMDDLSRIEAILGPRASNRATWAMTGGLGSKVGLGGLALGVSEADRTAENLNKVLSNLEEGTKGLGDVTSEAKGAIKNVREGTGAGAQALKNISEKGLPINVRGGVDFGSSVPWGDVAKWGGGAALGGVGLYALYRLLNRAREKGRPEQDDQEVYRPKFASALNPAELFLPEDMKKTASEEKRGSMADILLYTLGGAGAGGLGYGGYGAYQGNQSYQAVEPDRRALLGQLGRNFQATEMEPSTAARRMQEAQDAYLPGSSPSMWREFKPRFGKGALIGGGVGLGAALLKNLLTSDEPEERYVV